MRRSSIRSRWGLRVPLIVTSTSSVWGHDQRQTLLDKAYVLLTVSWSSSGHLRPSSEREQLFSTNSSYNLFRLVMITWWMKLEGNLPPRYDALPGADTGFPEGGGGVKTFTSTPPWTLSAWRHPPSKKWQIPPLLDIHKHPPLDIARVTPSTYS